MDNLATYRQIIMNLLEAYTQLNYADVNFHNEAIFDQKSDQYFVMLVESYANSSQGIHSCLIHIDIIDNKIWIKRDTTEEGLANQLVEKGIPKEMILLGFYFPDHSKYRGFAIA